MRRASALPAVLIVLVIAMTLGVTMFFTTRGGYRSTARAAYRLRLQMFMVAALDEARTRLFQLTSPNTGSLVITRPGLREALLNRIPVPQIPPADPNTNPYDSLPDLSTVDFEIPLGDFEGNPILWASKAIQFVDVPDNPPEYMGRIEILEAKARLHGFRRVQYDDQGKFNAKGFDYYMNRDPFEDTFFYNRDYVGYCTITLHARLRGGGSNPIAMQRRIQVTHDVKIVDNRPPAPDFALFAFRSTVGHEDRVYRALNEGGQNGEFGDNGEFDPENPPSGRLIVYPQAVGRIYIRGPYVMLTEGRTDGRGGDNPVPGPSYPGGRYSNWGGWSQVPGPRGATLPSKVTAFGGWPSPVRPEHPCTDNGSVSAGLPIANQAAAAYVTDPAGFGVPTPVAASSFGPNRQRLLLTGESGCFGLDHDSCGADAFRGILMHRPDQLEEVAEGEEPPPILEAFAPFFPMNSDGTAAGPVTWPDPGNDSGKELIKNYDQVMLESGPAMLGLYSVYKVYPFISGDGCEQRSGFLAWAGRVASSVSDFIAEVGTLGGYMSASYRRNPRDSEQGLVVDWDEAALREVASRPFGLVNMGQAPEDQDEQEEWFKNHEAFTMMLPFAMHYQSPETLGWARTLITLAVDVVATALVFLLPGPGLIVNGLLRTGASIAVGATARQGTRMAAVSGVNAAISSTFRGPVMGIGADLATMQLDSWAAGSFIEAVSPDATVGDSNNLNPNAPSPITAEAVANIKEQMQEEAARERAAIDVVSGESTGERSGGTDPAIQEMVDQVGSLQSILQAFGPNGQLWDRAADQLDSMMTGLPPRDNPTGLDELRPTETFGETTATRDLTTQDVAYFGFLPPRLRPYQRLATKWYRSLDDALVGDRRLNLEGVLAFDQYPQEDDNAPNGPLRFSGRGAIVSAAGNDPSGDNQKPAFRGGIEPIDPANDYLTLVYWTQLSPEQTRGKDGTGMVSLDSVQNWASIVANYGVRPLEPQVGIRGNLVTYFLDRNRFPDSANLRIFYRWEALRPDLAGDDRAELQASVNDEQQVRPWVSVAVSPKITRWYDSVE